MQRKTAIIHAGSSTTGEHRLHAALAYASRTLNDHDFLLPAAGRSRRDLPNHGNLVFGLMNNPRFDPALGGIPELDAELHASGNCSIILSSPLMPAVIRTPKALETLRGVLAAHGFHIHWVLYLRTYEDWLQHAYTEQLRAARTVLPCDEWVRESGPQTLADPCSVFAPLFNTGDQVSLRSFSLCKGNIVPDFLRLLDLPLDAAGPHGHEDAVGISSLKVRFHHLLARFARLHLDAKQTAELLSRAREMEWQLPEGGHFRGLPAATAAGIRRDTKTSYEKLLLAAGVDTPFDTFFPPLETAPETTPDPMEEALLYQTFVQCALR